MPKQEVLIPELHVKRGVVYCTSLEVADVFGKQHKNVLQSIDNLGCSEEFGRLNFQPTSYKDEMRKQREFGQSNFGPTYVTTLGEG